MQRSVSWIAACILAAGALRAQAPPTPQDQTVFRAGTTLVPVDVRAVGKDRRPVTDLREQDFTIFEDGVPQRIGHFSTQAFAAEPRPSAPTRPARAADALELTSFNSRTFLIVLGRGRLQDPSAGVDAMVHLMHDVALPQDHIAVLAWNRATDFTTDRDNVLRVLDRFRRVHVGLEGRILLWEKSLQRWSDPRHFP